MEIKQRIKIRNAETSAEDVAAHMNAAEIYYGLSSAGAGWEPSTPAWVVHEGAVVLPATAPTILDGVNIAHWAGKMGIPPHDCIGPVTNMVTDGKYDEITYPDGRVIRISY